MRIRVLDRILVAVAGLVLVTACVGLVAQAFFGVDAVGMISKVLTPETTSGKILAGVFAAALLILGVYCLLVLFRHRRRKDKFILQKTESGELAISLTSLEAMVRKCLEQHNEINTESIRLENQRDGLLIRIRGTMAGGISIPLTVDTLQKQVKQYVTACSGVEVKGIRVQIESTGEDAKDALFAIDPPTRNLLTKGSESAAAESSEEEPAGEVSETAAETEAAEEPEADKTVISEEAAAAAAMAKAESMMEDLDVEDDRPIHQRLFSTQEEPCIMPLPPENVSETAEAAPQDAEAEKEADSEEKTEPAAAAEEVTEERKQRRK